MSYQRFSGSWRDKNTHEPVTVGMTDGSFPYVIHYPSRGSTNYSRSFDGVEQYSPTITEEDVVRRILAALEEAGNRFGDTAQQIKEGRMTSLDSLVGWLESSAARCRVAIAKAKGTAVEERDRNFDD